MASPETLVGIEQAPEVAAAVRLLLRARAVVHAATLGDRLSARRGAGVEFLEHAPYVPGADVRRLDRMVSARAGRLLIRTYREEARRTVHVLLDRSPSMALARADARAGGADALSKGDAARVLALASVLAVQRMGDRARLYAFADAGLERLGGRSARSAQLALALTRLAYAREGTPTGLAGALRALAARARRGDGVVVISDLLSLDASPAPVLQAMQRRGQGALVILLLGPDDRELPAGPLRLVPVEGGDPIELDGDTVRESYARALSDFVARWHAELTAAGARMAQLWSDRALAPALADLVPGRHAPPRAG
jgi:uncharacterized protein (DUF58 family)